MDRNKIPIENRVVRKVFLRIIPFIFILYIIAYLDRVNVGYAALEMNKELGLTSATLGLISGVFFLGYFLFEIPSNVLLHRIGARKWIARILVSWGIVAIITVGVQNATQFGVLRFLLGIGEAGFFPGVVLYLTYWFRGKDRARAFALFLTASVIAGVIGAPVSTWILDHIHWAGMSGWRWLFLLEGSPAVILGIVTFFYLTDRPEEAKWLNQEEKDWLKAELAKEEKLKIKIKQHSSLDVLKNPKVWRFALTYITLLMGVYGIGFWMPTIIKGFSKLLTNTQVGLIAIIPYLFAAVAMILWGRHSDKTGERRIHAAIAAMCGAIGLIGCELTTNPYVSIVLISIALAGCNSFFAPFWTLPTAYLTQVAAAVGIAFINSFGNLGGFLGPYLVGYIKDSTGSVQSGLYVLGGLLVICSGLVFTIKKEEARSDQVNDYRAEANMK